MVKTISLYQLSLPLSKPTGWHKCQMRKTSNIFETSLNYQSYRSAQWSPIYSPHILFLSLFRIFFSPSNVEVPGLSNEMSDEDRKGRWRQTITSPQACLLRWRLLLIFHIFPWESTGQWPEPKMKNTVCPALNHQKSWISWSLEIKTHTLPSSHTYT